MTTKERVDDYVESWERRVAANAPNNETVDDVLKLMRDERYLNRGRWAALVVRLGLANERSES
jgi:hypothetical protein